MRVEASLSLLRDLELSAASGLVVREGHAWVVADDRLALHGYALDGTGAPQVFELAQGQVSATVSLRKRLKPDLEALYAEADGRLVALGSGSRANRSVGFAAQPATGRVHPLDLGALHNELRGRLGELNLEGAVRLGEALVLAHRGLGKGNPSQLVVLDAACCPTADAGAWSPRALRRVVEVHLGNLDGVPLGFTDLALHPTRGLHYLATAEHTDDAYADGSVSGSVFGRLDEAFAPTPLARLRPDLKCEGLAWLKSAAGEDHWLVVTDADDPARAAQLMTLRWPADA